MNDWQHRPLEPYMRRCFVDAIVVKVRAGQVVNRPIFAAIGVTLKGSAVQVVAATRSS
ncbi:MAG: family transposase [Pseudonocardiales bacterium]|nr:family transposase [Pseudonocardiales bacterium]